jgi:hypothetical protein
VNDNSGYVFVIPVAEKDYGLLRYCVRCIRKFSSAPIVVGVTDVDAVSGLDVVPVKWTSSLVWSRSQTDLYKAALDLFPGVERVARLDADILMLSDRWLELPEGVIASTLWSYYNAHGLGVGSVLSREVVELLCKNRNRFVTHVESREIWDFLRKSLPEAVVSMRDYRGMVHVFHPDEDMEKWLKKSDRVDFIHTGAMHAPRKYVEQYMQKNLVIFDSWCNKRV